MRYLTSESTYIIGSFPTGATVTIGVYLLSDNSSVVSAAAMTEVGTTGIFKYLFNPSTGSKTHYLYIMTDGSIEHAGQIVLGGYPNKTYDLLDQVDIKVDAIPTNPVLTNDMRLDFLVDIGGIPTNPLLTNDARLDNLDAAISSRSAFDYTKDRVDIGKVGGFLVLGVSDFKADVSGLATEANLNLVKSVTDILNGLIENVSGNRFTAKALEQAPESDLTVERIWEHIIESGYKAEDILRIIVAILAGKTTITDLGGGLATVKFRDLLDTKDRVESNLEKSTRTSVTIIND